MLVDAHANRMLMKIEASYSVVHLQMRRIPPTPHMSALLLQDEMLLMLLMIYLDSPKMDEQ